MAISNNDISYAIENSLTVLPEIPGILEKLSFPGVKAQWTPPSSFVMGNSVGQIRLDTDNADATIQVVHEFFVENRKSYFWVVSEMATPDDLGNRLEAAGLTRFRELSGMVLSDLSPEINENPAVLVRVATDADVNDVRHLYVHGYPIAEDFAKHWPRLIEAAGGHNYLAYFEGHEKPVSVASMFYLPDRPIAVLQTAATLPEFRRNGLYKSLVARRVADARADGMEAVILQANRATSAPICERLGFQEVHALVAYVWLVD